MKKLIELIAEFNRTGAALYITEMGPKPEVVAYFGTAEDSKGNVHLWYHDGSPHFGPALALLKNEDDDSIVLRDKSGAEIWRLSSFEVVPEIPRGESLDKLNSQRQNTTFKEAQTAAGRPAENGSFSGFPPDWDQSQPAPAPDSI